MRSVKRNMITLFLFLLFATIRLRLLLYINIKSSATGAIKQILFDSPG